MRILILCQSFAPLFEGGTERVARAHTAALVKLGHEVSVVACSPEIENRRTFEVDGYPVHFIPEGEPGPNPIAERLWLERPSRRSAVLEIAQAFTPDVVHIQHHASLSLGLATFPTRAPGLRVAISLHDLFATCPRFFRAAPPSSGVAACPSPTQNFATCATCIHSEAPDVPLADLAKALATRAQLFASELAAADVLIAPSQSHASRLEALLDLPPASIEVVPNGLVESVKQPAQHLAPPMGDEPLHVLHFGHRAPPKGCLELVEAANLAAADSPRPIHLTLAGRELVGGFDQELKNAATHARLKLDLRPGYTPEDLTDLAAAAHLCAFPSKALESYGLVIDEALALGLPVFAAESGALAERLNGAGRALPRPLSPNAINAWATAFVEVAQDPAQLHDWRRAIPDIIPGPAQAARQLIDLYHAPQS